jgi:4-hydroxybenzoate polyprenyltransferase
MMPVLLLIVARLIRWSHPIVLLTLAAVTTAAMLGLSIPLLPFILVGVIASSLRLGYDLGRLGMPI